MENSDPFRGRVFVLTGKLRCPRVEATKCIERLGGTVANKVSWRTDYLVAGDRTGSVKMSAARENGVQVITEDELDTLLSELAR